MFQGIFKSKFHNKCKSAIKLLKTRIEIIKKKRNAMQKYLRNDIADLLRSGLDIIAYGRVEGLLTEMNTSSCYDFVEQFCQHISDNLSVMSKQRECPEDCREAVSSLMYAAARFADLPELRDLRTLFAERYGNAVDYFVNKEFVEKFKSSSPTKDMKLQVMQDIATEAGVDWNHKATEQKLYNPSAFRQPSSKDVRINDDEPAKRIEVVESEAREQHRVSYNPERRAPSKDIQTDHMVGQEKERTPFKDIQTDYIISNGQETDPERDGLQEELHDKKASRYSSIPPPYTKPKVVSRTQHEEESEEPPGLEVFAAETDKKRPDDSVSESKRKPTSVRRQRPKLVLDNNDHNQPDEEERMIDRLLRHYSKKKSPRRSTRRQSWDVAPSPFHDEPSNPSDTKKGHARAASFQPEMFTGHVHPKLPDYDDFVARLAALKGGN